ncbi:MAG: potassium channel protein [Pirellulales bacterium]|nr:potassium channel protein [Pirellulales bacterium]
MPLGGVARIVVLLALLPLFGTIGFRIIEGWPWFDCLYMSVTTITTVGFMEVHPLSTAGRIFVMTYLIVGLGVFFFGVVQLGEMVVRIELTHWLEKRRMDSTIRTLKGHFIVCGYGRMGQALCRQMAAKRMPFVVIDRDESLVSSSLADGWPALAGDATDDHVLQSAGIERARGLAAVLASDADNLYIVLSARLLSKDLMIISRAEDDSSVAKLKKAGADRVMTLFETSAARMAHLLVNPNVEEFFEIFRTEGTALDLAEIHVSQNSVYAGRRLAETDLRNRGVIVVGIRQGSGNLVLPPPSSIEIQIDDRLIVLGRADAIAELMRAGGSE